VAAKFGSNCYAALDALFILHPETIIESDKEELEANCIIIGGGGFNGMQPHFNPAFFPQNQPAGGDWQNPHGAKRPRPE
jgi:hypothetical protein